MDNNQKESKAAISSIATPPKPPTKPKRPLSAFNLFYRFKRQKALEAIASGNGGASTCSKDAIGELLRCAAGLEHYPPDAPARMAVSAETLNDLRRQNIREYLERNLLPREDARTRPHRRTMNCAGGGGVGFLELGKAIGGSWRECDAFAKDVFNELAEEGRREYRRRIDEYHASLEKKGGVITAREGSGGKTSPRMAPSPAVSPLEDEDGGVATAATMMIQLTRKCPVTTASTSLSSFKGDGGGGTISLEVSPNPSTKESVVSNVDEACSGTTFGVDRTDNCHPPPGSEARDEASLLRARVKELEDELAVERLRSRVRELEDEVETRRARVERMRGEIIAAAEEEEEGGTEDKEEGGGGATSSEVWQKGEEEAAVLTNDNHRPEVCSSEDSSKSISLPSNHNHKKKQRHNE